MKIISFFLLIGALVVLNGAPWREMKTFTLKKDQTVKVMVKSEGQERLFTFRWTLYTDKVLVVHESFDRFVAQHMLQNGNFHQSFRHVLLHEKKSPRDVPSLVVVFKKFDEGAKTAQMDLLLIDKESRITLEYLTEK